MFRELVVEHWALTILQQHESRSYGRTLRIIVELVTEFSISTFSTIIRLTRAVNYVNLRLSQGSSPDFVFYMQSQVYQDNPAMLFQGFVFILYPKVVRKSQ